MMEEKTKEKKPIYKRWWFIALVVLVLFITLLGGGGDKKEDPAAKDEPVAKEEPKEGVKEEPADNVELEKLRKEVARLIVVEKEFEEYKEKMKPFEELSELEAEARQAELEAELAEVREAEEAERAEREAKELAELQAGYETGVTFDDLARKPKDYIGKKVKFTGEVVQLMEGTTYNQLRFAVNGDYDKMLYLEYDPSKLDERVLEDDTITIYGFGMDVITYDSTMGGKITIPAVVVDELEIIKN